MHNFGKALGERGHLAQIGDRRFLACKCGLEVRDPLCRLEACAPLLRLEL